MKRPVAQDILSRRRAEAAALALRVKITIEVEQAPPASLAERIQRAQRRGEIIGSL